MTTKIPLRIIHTGDIHIGLSLRKVSRNEEHIQILDWLIDTIAEHNIDVLLIAGDVFETANPDINAQTIFFNFLRKLVDIPSLRQVIITAGNHDSAGKLQSLCPVTEKLGIHIVGAIANRSAAWNDWIIPIVIDGEVQAVVNAIPYVSEYRLGIHWNLESKESPIDIIRNELRSLYTNMATFAKEKYPDVPLIGMGHLTAMDQNYQLGEIPQRIHRILEKGLDGDIFGNDYAYVALGHIHRKYKVRGSANAWYSGSLLPCSIAEAEDGSQRGVWMIELDGNPSSRPQPVEILAPVLRQMIRWMGQDKDVSDYLRNLTWTEKFPPFVYLSLETASYAKCVNIVRNTLLEMAEKISEQEDGEQSKQLPIIAKIDGKVTDRAISKEEKHQICSPESLMDPLKLFQDFVEFKEGTKASPEQIQLFMDAIQFK